MKLISLRGQNLHKAKRHVAFLVLELFAQALIFCSGLKVIHALSLLEYALYFSLLTIVGVATVVGDGGMTAGFSRLGGPLVGDKSAFAVIVATFSRSRKTALAILLPLLVVLGFWTLYRQGAPWERALLMLALFAAVCTTTLLQELQLQTLRLLGHFNEIQVSKIGTETLRAIVIFGALRFWPRVETLFLLMALTTFGQSMWLENRCRAHGVTGGKPDPKIKQELMRDYRALLPNSIYSAVQGQVSPLLLAWFGQKGAVADLGALTRLGRALDIVITYIVNVVGPATARCTSKQAVRNTTIKVLGAGGLISLVVVGCSVFLARFVLWILGAKYGGLDQELVIYAWTLCINLFIAIMINVNKARGWYSFSAYWQIPLSIFGTIAGILIFGTKTTSAVLWMGMFARLPILIAQSMDWIRGYRQMA